MGKGNKLASLIPRGNRKGWKEREDRFLFLLPGNGNDNDDNPIFSYQIFLILSQSGAMLHRTIFYDDFLHKIVAQKVSLV
jgi:hypothetical protein